MKQFQVYCVLVSFGLLTQCVSARETTWEAVPATVRIDESRPVVSRSVTITPRASVYDARNLGPNITWGNDVVANAVVTNASVERNVVASYNSNTHGSPVQLVSAVVSPTQPPIDNDFGGFNSNDVMSLDSVAPPQHVAPSRVQQPTSFHRWEFDTNDNASTPRTSQYETLAPAVVLAAAPPVHSATTTTAPTTQRIDIPAIDMRQNPKYATLLPNTMPCGVVLIQADFPLNEVELVAREIALLQEDLLHYLAVPAPREKIDLCLFASSKSYVTFLQTLFPNAPTDRPALFIKRPGEPATLLVQRDANFEIDLRHEMTHAILHARIDNVPMWLDEGLAKYLELPRSQRPYHNPYLKTVKWQSNLWMTSSLTRLESLHFVDEMGSREYRDSWAWIHFLIHNSPKTHQFLASYIQTLAAASDANRDRIPPMSRELSQAIDNPKSMMRAHFSRWPLPTTQQGSSTGRTESSSEGSLTSFFSKREKPTENNAPSKVATTESASKKWYQLW